MKDRREIQDFVNKLIDERESTIQNIIYAWFKSNQDSEILILNSQGQKVIDKPKAEQHLKLVELYSIILNIDFPLRKERTIIKPEGKSINPKYNEKLLKDYEKALKKEETKKENYNRRIKLIYDIIKSLNLDLTIEEILNDYKGSRSILKKLFKDNFSLYGIDLQEKMLENVFGKIKITNTNEEIDTIVFFTQNTYFNFPLKSQFSTTMMGQASGIFSAFFMRAAGRLKPFSNDTSDFTSLIEPTEKDNNPFWCEKKVVRILATAAACCK